MIKVIVVMLIIGGVLGLILGYAAKIFYVAPDTRVDDVCKLLPGYNCGGCGFAGCSGMAEALVNKEVTVELCKPSKPEAKEKINDYLKSLES